MDEIDTCISERLKRKIKVGRVLDPRARFLYQPSFEDVTRYVVLLFSSISP